MQCLTNCSRSQRKFVFRKERRKEEGVRERGRKAGREGGRKEDKMLRTELGKMVLERASSVYNHE